VDVDVVVNVIVNGFVYVHDHVDVHDHERSVALGRGL
jgi:hypothetical protein